MHGCFLGKKISLRVEIHLWGLEGGGSGNKVVVETRMGSLQPQHRPSCLPFSAVPREDRRASRSISPRRYFPTRLAHLISGSWRQAAHRATALPLPEGRLTGRAFFLAHKLAS